jgi:hypothetical protein
MKKWFNMNKIFVLLLAGCFITTASVAADSTNAVKQFIQQVQQAYRSANFLSFHVLYRYANKNQPDNYIDTMSGEVAMNRNHVRFILEDVETVTNDQYTIQVHKGEKLIYLTTPRQSQLADPVAALDSALSHFEGLRTRVTRTGGVATLNMAFPPGQAYKNVAMTINEQTGYLQKVVYDMYTEGLVDKDQMVDGGNGGPYQPEGRIEIVFSQYRQGQFTEGLFSGDQYFTRLGQGKYQPTEKYKDYQIFLASPKL